MKKIVKTMNAYYVETLKTTVAFYEKLENFNSDLENQFHCSEFITDLQVHAFRSTKTKSGSIR